MVTKCKAKDCNDNAGTPLGYCYVHAVALSGQVCKLSQKGVDMFGHEDRAFFVTKQKDEFYELAFLINGKSLGALVHESEVEWITTEADHD